MKCILLKFKLLLIFPALLLLFSSFHFFKRENSKELIHSYKDCSFYWDKQDSRAALKIENKDTKGLVLKFDFVLLDKVGHIIYRHQFKKLKLGSGIETHYDIAQETYDKIKDYIYEVKLINVKIRKRITRKN